MTNRRAFLKFLGLGAPAAAASAAIGKEYVTEKAPEVMEPKVVERIVYREREQMVTMACPVSGRLSAMSFSCPAETETGLLEDDDPGDDVDDEYWEDE